MSASDDVESQQKGVVFFVWPGPTAGMRNMPNQTDRALHHKCNDAAPIRIAAVHFCFPNEPFYHLLRSIMTMTLGIAYRLRLKFHVGEYNSIAPYRTVYIDYYILYIIIEYYYGRN